MEKHKLLGLVLDSPAKALDMATLRLRNLRTASNYQYYNKEVKDNIAAQIAECEGAIRDSSNHTYLSIAFCYDYPGCVNIPCIDPDLYELLMLLLIAEGAILDFTITKVKVVSKVGVSRYETHVITAEVCDTGKWSALSKSGITIFSDFYSCFNRAYQILNELIELIDERDMLLEEVYLSKSMTDDEAAAAFEACVSDPEYRVDYEFIAFKLDDIKSRIRNRLTNPDYIKIRSLYKKIIKYLTPASKKGDSTNE